VGDGRCRVPPSRCGEKPKSMAAVVLRVNVEREEPTACCFGAGNVGETDSGNVLERGAVRLDALVEVE
jgi:hypothetical protein